MQAAGPGQADDQPDDCGRNPKSDWLQRPERDERWAYNVRKQILRSGHWSRREEALAVKRAPEHAVEIRQTFQIGRVAVECLKQKVKTKFSQLPSLTVESPKGSRSSTQQKLTSSLSLDQRRSPLNPYPPPGPNP